MLRERAIVMYIRKYNLPNIIKIIGTFDHITHNALYPMPVIIMEQLTGGDLFRRITCKKQFSEQMAASTLLACTKVILTEEGIKKSTNSKL